MAGWRASGVAWFLEDNSHGDRVARKVSKPNFTINW